MTTGILTSMRHRDLLFKQQLGKNNEQLSKTYRKKRNAVSRLIEEAKDLHMWNTFKNVKDNPKKMWSKINTKVLNKKKKGNALPSEITLENKTIDDQTVIANKFNEYFINKGHILASKLPTPQSSILDSMKPKNENTITAWENTHIKEVLDIIRESISLGKSPGYDNISALLVKWSAHYIASLLVKLFNRFIELGKYPDILKIAKVTSLHKGGEQSIVDNYCPISVLTHFNKIFEKLIYVRLNGFVQKHDILVNSQYGFRKAHSTSHGINYSFA